jgi:glyoxylase-like metal-dependent hydrolase (beta-lactamase superfamily II)
MKQIPLEDTFADIIGKAARGRGYDPVALAAAAGNTEAAVREVLSGKADLALIAELAEKLSLSPERVVSIAKGEYKPAAVELPAGVAHYNTPFDDMTVNSFLAWDAESKKAVAFDTGTDCDGVLETLAKEGLTLEVILLTHSHGDHIIELDRLVEKTKAPAWIGEKEPIEGAQTFAVGKTFEVGKLKISTRSTWGHSPGGVTYVVEGLASRLAIVGDAIFAGSMGGGNVSYPSALSTNRENILTLPDDTIICPGHGPLTTVGEQKAANPFFP